VEQKVNGNILSKNKILLFFIRMVALLITSIIGGTSFIVGTLIGFITGDRIRRRIETDRNYDELIRYYENQDTQFNEDTYEDTLIM